jgi:hypothetical protein
MAIFQYRNNKGFESQSVERNYRTVSVGNRVAYHQEPGRSNFNKYGTYPVFRIRFCFNADPDPAFTTMRVQIRIQGAKPTRINADPDPGQTFAVTKSSF